MVNARLPKGILAVGNAGRGKDENRPEHAIIYGRNEKAARLRSQTGGARYQVAGALRALRPSRAHQAWDWLSEGGGVGRERCCAMNWSNSSLSLA